jgi:hypothetical protein
MYQARRNRDVVSMFVRVIDFPFGFYNFELFHCGVFLFMCFISLLLIYIVSEGIVKKKIVKMIIPCLIHIVSEGTHQQ